MNRMKKSCIAVIILMLLLLPICTIAHGYNYDLTEIPKEEANGILSQFHFKSVSQDEVGGYINNFDIDPKTGEICVSFDSNDGHDRAQWACVYGTDGAYRYGVYTDWYMKMR